MPAVDIAPLMNSPLWKSWDEPTRAEAKRLLEDPATSAEDRAQMLRLVQPAGAIEPIQPGGVERALESRTPFKPMGTVPPTDVALPFQRPNVLPSQREAPLEEKTFVGEADIGEMAGTLLVPGPLKPFAGAAGAGIGEGMRQWREGEPFSPMKIGKEAGLSLLPEVVESAGRGMIRQFARESPGGIRLRHDEAAREARQVPERVFQPKPAEEISDAFEQVRRTNLPIDLGDIRNHLTTLSVGKQADTLNLLTTLDRQHKTGGRYVQLYHDVTTGQRMTNSIGDLQNLRSVLRQEADGLAVGSEERQLVRRLQGAVDDTIDFGLTQGAMAQSAPQIRETLHTARRDWANRVAADDMGSLIEAKISSSPNLEDSILNLKGIADELRRGRSEASRSINRSLDMTPGARDRFNEDLKDISRLYRNIEMSMTDVSGIYRMPGVAAVRQGVGQLLLSDWGRKEFRDAVIDGRGHLSANALATLLNAARREMAPALTKGAPGGEREESRYAPGGVARSTD